MNLQPLVEKAASNFRNSELCDVATLTTMLKHLEISVNPRLRTKGGLCRWKHFPKIKQIIYLEIEVSGHFIRTLSEEKVFYVVAHEMAHAYQFVLSGESDHGIVWKNICLAFGGDGLAFHAEAVQRNKVRRIVIEDIRNGKQYKITPTRANRLLGWCPHYRKVSEYVLDRNLTSV